MNLTKTNVGNNGVEGRVRISKEEVYQTATIGKIGVY